MPGEDVVDVHVFPEEHRVVKSLARAEILRAFLHQQRVDALVGGGKAHPHGFQAVGAENSVPHGGRLGRAGQPGGHFQEVAGDARFDRRAVEFPEHAAPVPAFELFPLGGVFPGIADVGEGE